MKTIWGILLASILTTHALQAQNQVVIDSLQHILDKAKGKQKVRVLNGLAGEFMTFKAEKSLAWAQEALQLSEDVHDEAGRANSYYNKGMALFQQKRYSESLRDLLQASAMYEKLGDKRGKGVALVQIGQVYKLRDDYKQAFDKFKRSLDIFKEIDDKAGEATALGQVADVHFRLHSFNEALKYAEESLNLAQEVNPDSKTNPTARESCKILAEAHKNLNNFEEAFNYQNLYTSINDSIREYREALAIDLQSKKHEREVKEKETQYRQQLHKEQEKKDKEYRDTIQYSLIVFIFFVLFGGILFFMGRFTVSQNVIDTMIFLSVLLLSRFCIVLIMPLAASLGADAPLLTLGANFLLALILMPLQKYLERTLRNKVQEDIAEEGEKERLREKVKELSEQIENTKLENTKQEPSPTKETALHKN